MMRKFIQVLFIFIFLFFAKFECFAIDISNTYNQISKAFDIFSQENEGESAFRSLLIPSGGRFAGLGYAFTALSNDASFFDANPAGSAIMDNTEIICFHNNWIADAKLETVNYSQRKKDLGWGASLRTFYIPFTEYGPNGEKKSSGFYTESFLVGNVSYNFLAGYDFKGIALGANFKLGLMTFPPFEGQDSSGSSSADHKNNAKMQTGFTAVVDLGIIIRANLWKKFYSDEPNFSFGLAFKNFGPPIKGNSPPAYISLGIAYRPAEIFLFTLDLKENINLTNIKGSGKPYGSLGMMFKITKYFNLLSGVGIRGGNPHFNIGGEVNLKNIHINANYSLDLANQSTALNKISISAKISLGDDGRKERKDKVKSMYIEGLKAYTEKNYTDAIEIWEELLKINPRFDPAIEGIKIAGKQKEMQDELKKILEF